MKRQSLISLLVGLCLIIPSEIVIDTSYDEQLLFNDAQVPEFLPRIYRENLAPAIYSFINSVNYLELVRDNYISGMICEIFGV